MIAHFEGIANDLAYCAKRATSVIRDKYDLENEDILSARFLDRFEKEIDDYSSTITHKLDIETYKLNDKGPDAPETRFGPDFVVGYNFKVSNFDFKSGVLVQAKKGKISDLNRLSGQCREMIKYSPDSFIYKFSKETSGRSFRMFPALQVAQTNGPHPVYSGEELDFDEAYGGRTTLKFYRLFFSGYVGDNWVYQNMKFLADPNNHSKIDRPVATDGGEYSQDDEVGGAKVLIVSVREPDNPVELPFDEDDTVDEFKPGPSTAIEW
jgi:hypothetical protein